MGISAAAMYATHWEGRREGEVEGRREGGKGRWRGGGGGRWGEGRKEIRKEEEGRIGEKSKLAP